MGGLFGGGINTSETRIAGLHVQTSCYGGAKAVVIGTTRIAGNLIWYGDFQAISHTESQGGKGGGQTSTTYTYRAAVAIALCHGPISGIRQFWQGKNIVEPVTYRVENPGETFVIPPEATVTVAHLEGFTATIRILLSVGPVGENFPVNMQSVTGAPAMSGQYHCADGIYTFHEDDIGSTVEISYTYTLSAVGAWGLSIFTGETNQSPWGYLATAHPSEALPYSGLAYVAAPAYALSSSAELPNHTFEVIGLHASSSSLDVAPETALTEVLTAEIWGAGWPAEYVGDLSSWADYCAANGWRLSLGLTDQRSAGEIVTELMTATNSECVWSENVLKVIPYGDEAVAGNGVTWTPDLEPAYDLTDDDLLPFDGGPVRQYRSDQADAHNLVTIEWINRANSYAAETFEAKDAAEINRRGRRPAEKLDLHCIHDGETAAAIAYLRLRRTAYVRPTYEIRLGWEYCLLEPMDIVGISDTYMGLSSVPVRIIEIGEDEEGTLTARVEELLAGTGARSDHAIQPAGGYLTNWAEPAGAPNDPILIEAPFAATDGALELWVIATGGETWGGADVYVSLDGDTYSHSGAVQAGAITGRLAAAMAIDADYLDVDVSESRGELLTVPAAAFDTLQSRIYVGGEWMAYQTATLTAAYTYRLSGLNRGLYGTTVAAHLSGSRFARLQDRHIQRQPLTTDLIGKTLRLKLVGYNRYGSGVQSIADCPAYEYTLTGAALKMPPDDVDNLVMTVVSGQTWLKWDAIVDVRRFAIEYEVRLGAAWGTADIIGRTTRPEFVAVGDGLYWVTAVVGGIHSAVPATISISGAVAIANVVATYDDANEGWPGTLSGSAVIDGDRVSLSHSGGVVASSGYYESPAVVDIGQEAACQLSASYRLRSANIIDTIAPVPQFSALASVAGAVAGLAGGGIEIAVAPQSGTYGAWQPFYPGQRIGRKFKFRIHLQSYASSVRPILDVFRHAVDMPDRIERGINVSCTTSGLVVVFAKPFQISPAVHVSILSAQPGDIYVLSAVSTTGFTVSISNSGNAVARSINWTAHAY